jgi:hypothetical protein
MNDGRERARLYTIARERTRVFDNHRQDHKEDRKRKNLHCREPTDTVGQRVPPMLVLTIQGGNRWNS